VKPSKPAALVLGAGIQGLCAAFALQSRGYRVQLVDQADACMTRASGRNEAKIHLGFVYANDDSFRTASLMLDACLAFAPLLDSWLGKPLDWRSMRSRPFVYAVMRDSLLSFDQLCAFYARVQDACLERLRSGTYLGERPAFLWRPIPPPTWPAWIAPSQVAGLIETAEVALDLGQFSAHMASALATSGIELLFGVRVESAARTPSGFRAEGSTATGESWRREADILVNCLWEDRLRLDETMGLRPSRPWVYRLKYRLLGELPPPLANLPSLTFVLGPYGDIATYPASPTYMNWYPACLQGWSDDLAPPPAWNEPCDGRVTAAAAAEITRQALSALDRIVPGLAGSRIDRVDAGVIFSWGESHIDVDDPGSELHQRHAIGVHAHDGYFSIDTGKFTCAPLFASHLLDALE